MKVFEKVSEWAHTLGIRLLRYLDDWLIVAESKETCFSHLRCLLAFLDTLGVVVNEKKSEFVPTQTIQYLGMHLDTIQSLVSPSPERVQSLRERVRKFILGEDRSAHMWESILGTRSSMEKIVPWGRLRMRYMQWQLKRAWSPSQSPDIIIHPSIKVQADLKW